MQKIKKGGFTLVELIVVITILAILGTITFISLQGYSRDARDSKRTADLGNIKTSLELFLLKTGKYPLPDSYSTIIYSGGTEKVWYQGNVGDIVTTNLKSLNEKPLDPLTNTSYTYSVTNSFKEYEILVLYEGSVAYNSIISQTNAATTNLTPKIDGNYNGVFVKTKNYIIPVPSIITSENIVSGNGTPLTTSIAKSLVITNGTNIPKTTVSQVSTGALSNFNLLVYTGSINKQSTKVDKMNVIRFIQSVYTGTILSNNSTYSKILNSSENYQLLNLANDLIVPELKIPNVFYKTVKDCGLTAGEVIYGTKDGGSGSLSCDKDIIICNGIPGNGYTINACNVGQIDVNGYSKCTNSSNCTTANVGQLFQWGRNKGFDIEDNSHQSSVISGIIGLNSITDTYGFVWDVNLPPSNPWANSNIEDNWGFISNTDISRKGSCPIGYHVPTKIEWQNLILAGGWCNGSCGGYDDFGSDILDKLRLPLGGYRSSYNGNIISQGSSIKYWTSDGAFSLYGYLINISSNNIKNNFYWWTSEGYSIRCFRN